MTVGLSGFLGIHTINLSYLGRQKFKIRIWREIQIYPKMFHRETGGHSTQGAVIFLTKMQ